MRVTKKMLLEKIGALERFHAMPIVLVRCTRAHLVRDAQGFVSSCQYTQGPIREHEIGTVNGRRYVSVTPGQVEI